ncbi:hypothetical protein NQZ68_015656, partial [Dissostichus eleginoides]
VTFGPENKPIVIDPRVLEGGTDPTFSDLLPLFKLIWLSDRVGSVLRYWERGGRHVGELVLLSE